MLGYTGPMLLEQEQTEGSKELFSEMIATFHMVQSTTKKVPTKIGLLMEYHNCHIILGRILRSSQELGHILMSTYLLGIWDWCGYAILYCGIY